ncbi:class I SAM-dependent methyltransferase [bacterium]|nr:class I SAM-dependent methyltransferase [bacterium]
MSDKIAFYTKKNIDSWNEAAPRHASINSSLISTVLNPAFNNLNPDFDALVDSCNIKNKSVVQVCCNNGLDILSVKNKGAARCLGIDGSKEFISQAKELSEDANQPDMEFLHSNIYDLPDEFKSSFDLVIITVGVFGWMPDIYKFMEVCSSLLVADGQLLVEEIHPILGMYEEGKPSYIDSSYFNKEPIKDSNGLDYFNKEKYDAKENYWFHHSLTEILMAAISNNLRLEHIKELSYNVGNFCADLEFVKHNPPLGINLSWRKIE